jgi:cell fate regulator YaaT (PSP1 superfamily)
MCCLKNEEEAYEELNSRLPNIGDMVTTPEGLKGEVQSVSVLKQLVKVIVTMEKDEKEVREYKAEELKFKSRKRKERLNVDGELKELEMLEKKETKSKLDDD